ncbi:TPA: PD-(D/E)XK nuclease-like domain-containing protein [Legionella pneumophila]
MVKLSFKDGIHSISNEEYHKSEGISRSALMEIKRSPYHYWYKYLNPNAEPEKPTPAMKLGEYVHALVLEPNEFSKRYVVEPQIEPLPKVGLLKDLGREEYDRQKLARESMSCANELIMDAFYKESEGKEVIKPDVYLEAKSIADAVLCNDIAQSLFDGVKVEQSIYFTHKETGLQCKVRPDAWLGSLVTDLKTCADASYSSFQSAAFKEGYFIQAAMIKYALESIGLVLEKFLFFCVEKSYGHPCVYYPVDEESLFRGEKEFNKLMFKVAECMDKSQWGAYESYPLCYPKWALYEE